MLNLLESADKIITKVMPCILLAAGLEQGANELKKISPIFSRLKLTEVLILLNKVCKPSKNTDKALRNFVKESKFWCEAAILAVIENNSEQYVICINKMIQIMEQAKSEIPVTH